MGLFLDFEEIKRRVSLTQAAQLLALQLTKSGPNQMRGACPACKGGGPRALVITEQKGWYCFSAQTGGDVIALAAHIRGCSVKEAAKLLSGAPTIPDTVPQERGEKNLTPLSYLEHDHASVLALGFDAEVAKRLGIGYAAKGLMRGTVAVPIRDETGNLIGYIGLEDGVRLPPDFMSNVVPIGKKSA